MKKILLILVLSFFAVQAFAKGEVTNIYAHKELATASTYTVEGITHYWGQGTNLVIDGFEYGGVHYGYSSVANRVEIVRSNNDHASGAPCGLFSQKGGTSKYELAPTYPPSCDMGAVMGGRVINIGALDLFRNSGNTAKNIERVDFITDDGIIAPILTANLAKAGHVITEKSGNNPIKIAAILSLDAAGNPSSYGTLVDVGEIGSGSSHSYGIATIHLPDATTVRNMTIEFLVNAQNGTQGEPWQISEGYEPLGMSFISLESLGINAGQKYYGFSFFGEDVTTEYKLTDPSSFPVDNLVDTADPFGGVAGYFMDEEISTCPVEADKNSMWYVDYYNNGSQYVSNGIYSADISNVSAGVKTYNVNGNDMYGDIAVAPDGFIYVASMSSNEIIKFSKDGTTKLGSLGSLNVGLSPNGLTFDENSYLYVGYSTGAYYRVENIANVRSNSIWFNPRDIFTGNRVGSSGDVIFAEGKAYISINDDSWNDYLVELTLDSNNAVTDKKVVGKLPSASYGLSTDGFGRLFVASSKSIYELDISNRNAFSNSYTIPKTLKTTVEAAALGMAGLASRNESLGNACVEPLKPFTCDDTMYFSNASEIGVGVEENAMYLHSIIREQSPFSFNKIGEKYDRTYNALAYNPKDDFLYATYENELLVIDSMGMVKSVGDISGLQVGRQHYAGTFGLVESDGKAYYYLSDWDSPSKLYKIDVESKTIVQTIIIKNSDKSIAPMRFVDMTIDESGEYLYLLRRDWLYFDGGIDNGENQLMKVRISDGSYVSIGDEIKRDTFADSIFCDITGKVYVLYNKGGFYKIDTTTGTQTAISSVPDLANLNDGAMCPNATVSLKPTVIIGDAQVVEGDSGTSNLVFPITYVNGNSSSIAASTFDYATKDGNDTNNQLNAINVDYESVKGSGHIDSIVVPVKGDLLIESDEKLSLVLSNIKGALSHDSNLVAIGTVVDNDADHNAFSCDTNSFIFTSNPTDDYTKALNVNFMDNRIDTLKEEFNKQSAENIRGSHINAIGYNVQDNYIYGWEWDASGCKDWTCSDRVDSMYNPGVVRIDKDFNIKRIDISGFTDKRVLYAGDVSLEGKYYLSGSKAGDDDTITATDEIFVIDLKNQVLERTLLLSEVVKMADFAFCPTDNKIYTVEHRIEGSKTYNDLIRIDPMVVVNGKTVVERLGEVSNSDDNLSNAYTNVTFFDRSGNLYFYAASNPQPSVYKIDISNPDDINTTAVLYKDIKLSSGDGGRCSLAPIENVYELNITNSSAIEGNSGYNDMNFTITLDREVFEESGLPINYTLTSGSEVIDADKNNGTFIIPKDTKVYTLALPVVKGDIIVEENKNFHINFSINRDLSYPDKEVMTVDNHKVEIRLIANDIEGLVLDDDYNTLMAFDVGDSVDKKIKTKIVNGAFVLAIAPIASDGSISDFADMNETKIKIVNSNECVTDINALTDTTGFVEYNTTKSPREETFRVTQAMKSARVQFWWKNKYGYQVSCSPDLFSVRPKKFKLDIPTNLVAGKPFDVNITAIAQDGSTVMNYEEPITMYKLDVKEHNASNGCTLGSITKTPTNVNFVAGVSTVRIKYADVGMLDFNVSEVNTTNPEYASIDAADSSKSVRSIGPDEAHSTKIRPAKISLTTSLDSDAANDIVFYAGNSDNTKDETDDMAAKLYTLVKVEDEDGNSVNNFNATCYGEDITITAPYSVLGENGLNPVTQYTQTQTGTPSMDSSEITFTIDKSLFTNGEGNQTVKINFERDASLALNPMSMTIAEVNASLGSISKAEAPIAPTKTFIYLRAHVASPQTNVGDSKDIKVNYEVYKDDSADDSVITGAGLENLAESSDAVNWYIISDPTLLSGLDYNHNPQASYGATSNTNSGSTPSANTLEAIWLNPTTMKIKVPKLPYKNKIIYSPSTQYLMYNRFNAAATAHSFKINFMANSQNWSGKGSLGMIVDGNTSVGNGLQKVDW